MYESLLFGSGGSSTSLLNIWVFAGAAVIVCNSCLLLQNEVVQRHAEPEIPDSGSDTSLMLQSAVGLNGLSIGPRTTDLGKHSLKTAVSVENNLKDMLVLSYLIFSLHVYLV